MGSSAWALNRFVIDHTEITDVASYEAANQRTATTASAASTANATTEATITADSYTSGTTQLSISRRTQGSGDDTITYYVADLRLTNATALRSAFTNNQFGTNIVAKPSAIAAEHDAVWAVNGDYYGFRSDGILIRNGVVYRDSGVRDGIALYTDGRVELYDETTTNAQTLLDAGVWNTLSFGPALLNDGQVLAGIEGVEVDTNFGNHSIQGPHPRTAVGVVENGHLIFVVVDGRNKGYSRGASLTELATIMHNLGCTKAYNLDGGGSSAMYWDGHIINQPSNGGERNTSDILYIAQVA